MHGMEGRDVHYNQLYLDTNVWFSVVVGYLLIAVTNFSVFEKTVFSRY